MKTMKKIIMVLSLLIIFILTSCVNDNEDKYKITLDLDGGTSSVSSILVEKNQYVSIPDPTKIGYDFKGWLNDGVLWNENTTIQSNLTLKAKWEIVNYQISYNLSGGIVNTPNITSYNITMLPITLNPAIKDGYRFIGWSNNGNIITSLNNLAADLKLDAIFAYEEYQITYELNGGINNPNNPSIYQINQLPLTLENPTKENMEFVGWFLNNELITNLDITKRGNLTLEARFKEIEYEITYNLNGGVNNSNNPSTYKTNQLPLVLQEPTKAGMHFLGWYYNDSSIVSIPISFKKDIILEARFEEIYSITYQGMNVDNLNNPTSYYASMGQISLISPECEGYNFVGWQLDQKIVMAIPNDVTGDLILTALFDEIVYNITYELEGGINSIYNPSTITISKLPFTLKNPTKEGYIFMGWQYNGEAITIIDETMLKDITLTLSWKLIPVYSDIIYILNGGSVPSGTLTQYEEGVGITLVEPTRTNYEFIGWNTKQDGSGPMITSITSTEKGSKTFYAIWRKIPVYSNITYELNGGSITGQYPTQYEEGVSLTLPIPEKTNFKFTGWFDNLACEGEPLTMISTQATGNLIFFAKFESLIQTYTITYNLNGGSYAVNYPYQDKNEMIIDFLNDTKSYLKSLGWTGTDISLNNDHGHENDYFGVTYLYASSIEAFFTTSTYKTKWSWMLEYIRSTGTDLSSSTLIRANIQGFIYNTKLDTWPYSFDFSDATWANGFWSKLPSDPINVITTFKQGDEDIVLPKVIRNEYTFLGWYDENNQLVTVISSSTNHNVVLNARFESIYHIYTITYHLNNGIINPNAIYEFTEKDEVTLPNIIKNGYQFNGWYDNASFSGSAISTISKGTNHNIELYAKFTPITYTITYHLNEGTLSVNNPSTYTVESSDINLNNPSKANYTFIGWYNENNVKYEAIIKGTTGNLDLYAVYEAVVNPTVKYNVEFINYNGIILNTLVVNHGEKVSMIALNSVEGLELGWYLDGELYDFDKVVTQNIKLNAKWKVIDEIYSSIFKTPEINENLIFGYSYSTSAGTISTTFSSSDMTTINTTTGFVNPNYGVTVVDITGTFQKGTTKIIITKKIKVASVNFVSLNNYKPVIGYIYSNMSSFTTPNVSLNTLDIVNYGFARVTTSGVVSISELNYMNKALELRKQGVRVLLCIGGYGNAAKEFSDAASTAEGRIKLASSILSYIKIYHFDGVDIDWEYPGYQTGRPTDVDSPNYTALMTEIRRQLKAENPDYLVTAATPGGKYGYVRYELGKLNSILDYINLMTYDLQSSSNATHHTALYSGSYTPHGSVKQTVDTYIAQGVQKSKLIVGIAFYGRIYTLSSYSNTSGINGTNSISSVPSITYTNIYNNYLTAIKNGSTTIKRYWDETSKAPYIFDSVNKKFISYDDPESIGYKCQYVKDNNLGGVMFWDYGEDKTYQLIQAIYDNFR